MHPTEEELVLETEWLLQRLQATTSSINEDALRIKIRKFLQLYRITKYEVPFIARYRRHYLEPDLEIKHLWDLYFWDIEWGNVYETKKVYGETIRKAAENAATLQVNDEVIQPADKILVNISKPGELPEDVNTLLDYNNHEKATSELNDLRAFIEVFVYTHGEDELSKKSSQAAPPLAEARKCKLGDFAVKAGLTPLQLNENVSAKELSNVPKNPGVKPQELAHQFKNEIYS
jgi:transcription elongation factor SPT6